MTQVPHPRRLGGGTHAGRSVWANGSRRKNGLFKKKAAAALLIQRKKISRLSAARGWAHEANTAEPLVEVGSSRLPCSCVHAILGAS
jgi:hypothetical protein